MKSNLLNHYKEHINKIAFKHGVRSIRVFGSFARGEETVDCDIYLLVELEPKRSLLDSAWQKTPNFQKTRTSAVTVNSNDFLLGSIFRLLCLTDDNDSHLSHYPGIALPSTFAAGAACSFQAAFL